MSDNILLLTEGGDYLIAENGDYLIAVVQYLTIANNGSYSVTGYSATISKSYSLLPSYGSYAITGRTIDINISAGRLLFASNGSYSIYGNDANIVWSGSANTALQPYIELRSFTERRRM